VSRLFTVNSFESDFPLVLDADGVKGKNVNMPDGIRYLLILYDTVHDQKSMKNHLSKSTIFINDCSYYYMVVLPAWEK
jgi:hypothetical protein